MRIVEEHPNGKEPLIQMKKFPHIRNGKINCMNCLFCKIQGQENGNNALALLNLYCKKGFWEDEEDAVQVRQDEGMTDNLETLLKDYAEGCLEFEPMDE